MVVNKPWATTKVEPCTVYSHILNETFEFYKRLYTSERTDNSSQNFLLNKMTRTLSDSDRDECEGEITLDEVRSAIKYFNNDK